MEGPRHWRLKAQRYRLEGMICPKCGQPMFPPRPICMKCHSTTWRAKDPADLEVLIIPPLNRLVNDMSPERMIG